MWAIGGKVQPGLDKCFLSGVFRDLYVSAHAIDYIPDALSMDADQLAKRVSFSGFRPMNKLYFVDRCNCRHFAISLSIHIPLYIRKSPGFYSKP